MSRCSSGDTTCQVRNCSGAVGNGNALFEYWQFVDCPVAYSSLINTGPTGVIAYNAVNLAQVQRDVSNLFNTYFETNTITDDVTSPQFNDFQFTLRSLCTNPTLPGICTEFLTNYCAGFTREQVQNSPILIDFCGCYTPPDPTYLALTVPPGCTGPTGCTGSPECDPLCRRVETSQKSNAQTGKLITCDRNICVIDQVTIDVINTRVPGGINFNSICPGCGGTTGAAGCLCIIGGITIEGTLGTIGNNVNITQFCGPNSICVIEDSAGNVISQGPCPGDGKIPLPQTSFLPNISLLFLMLLVVGIIIILIIAARDDS